MNTSKTNDQTTLSYDPGHPWHYVLGGTALYPKQILQAVMASGYQGYLADTIQQAAQKNEPERSTALRTLKANILTDFKANLARYREVVRDLQCYDAEKIKYSNQRIDTPPICDDVHVNVSLKHNHLYNDFAHLFVIDKYLAYQKDLGSRYIKGRNSQ